MRKESRGKHDRTQNESRGHEREKRNPGKARKDTERKKASTQTNVKRRRRAGKEGEKSECSRNGNQTKGCSKRTQNYVRREQAKQVIGGILAGFLDGGGGIFSGIFAGFLGS